MSSDSTSRLRSRVEAAALKFADEIVAAIELHSGSTEWVDQNESPLGKRRHLEAVRRGELPASKDGKRVLVKRADLDAYIRQKAIVTGTDESDVDDVLADVGLPARRMKTG